MLHRGLGVTTRPERAIATVESQAVEAAGLVVKALVYCTGVTSMVPTSSPLQTHSVLVLPSNAIAPRSEPPVDRQDPHLATVRRLHEHEVRVRVARKDQVRAVEGESRPVARDRVVRRTTVGARSATAIRVDGRHRVASSAVRGRNMPTAIDQSDEYSYDSESREPYSPPRSDPMSNSSSCSTTRSARMVSTVSLIEALVSVRRCGRCRRSGPRPGAPARDHGGTPCGCARRRTAPRPATARARRAWRRADPPWPALASHRPG